MVVSSQLPAKARARLTAKVSGHSAQVTALAHAIALPGEHAPIRNPNGGQSTAVIRCRNEFTTSSPSVGAYQWAAGDTIVALFGQAARAVMYYGRFTGPITTYRIYFSVNGSDSVDWAPDPNNWVGGAQSYSATAPMPFAGARALTTGGPHGPTLAVGYNKDDRRYFFLDKHDTLRINVPITPVVGEFRFAIDWWNEDAEEQQNYRLTVASSTSATQTGTFTPTQAGWFTVDFEELKLSSGTLTGGWRITADILVGNGGTANPSTDGGRWHLRPFSDFDPYAGGDAAMAELVRMNAASVLVQNISSTFNAQGPVLAGRVRIDNLMQLSNSLLATVADKYDGKAADGCYTFLANSEISSRFTECRSGSFSSFLRYPLEAQEYIHVMRFTNENWSTQANSFNIIFDGAFEFVADTARYPRHVAKGVSLETFNQMRMLINERPVWFYENPMHMADIYGFVKRAARGAGRAVGRAAPYLSTVATALDPAGAAGYSALAALLSRLA